LSLTVSFAGGSRDRTRRLYVTGVRDEADLTGDGALDEIVPERDVEGRLVYAIDDCAHNVNRARQLVRAGRSPPS
jgi:hypothetical protein